MKKLLSIIAIIIILTPNAFSMEKAKNTSLSDNVKRLFFLKKISKGMPNYIKKIKEAKNNYPEAVSRFKEDLKKRTNIQLIRSVFIYKDKELKKELENYLITELNSFILAQKYKQSNDEKIKEQLYDTLQKSFELKTKLQKKIIKKLEQRIKTLKSLLRKREEIKETIINERLNYLVSDHLTEW